MVFYLPGIATNCNFIERDRIFWTFITILVAISKTLRDCSYASTSQHVPFPNKIASSTNNKCVEFKSLDIWIPFSPPIFLFCATYLIHKCGNYIPHTSTTWILCNNDTLSLQSPFKVVYKASLSFVKLITKNQPMNMFVQNSI